MSHFTVMVIGEDVAAQLQPYHEYECTGIDDVYVIDIDCSDKVAEWLDEKLYVGIDKESGEPDYQHREESANECMIDCSVMTRLDWFQSIDRNVEEEIHDYFGYRKNDEGKYFQHTNPNAKWDWYQVGGRWQGFFQVHDPEQAELGEESWTNKGQRLAANFADVTTKGNVDLESMMDDLRVKKEETFDHLEKALRCTAPVSWTETLARFENDGKTVHDAREWYQASDFKRAINEYNQKHDNVLNFWYTNLYDEFFLHLPMNQARIRYVETACLNVVTPYAFVKDGQWVEKGEMGWWGMSHNEMDKDDWSVKFLEMFKALPDDTLLTVVDCHI